MVVFKTFWHKTAKSDSEGTKGAPRKPHSGTGLWRFRVYDAEAQDTEMEILIKFNPAAHSPAGENFLEGRILCARSNDDRFSVCPPRFWEAVCLGPKRPTVLRPAVRARRAAYTPTPT